MLKLAFPDGQGQAASLPSVGLVLGVVEAVGGGRDETVVVGVTGVSNWRASAGSKHGPGRVLKWSGKRGVATVADTLAAVGHRQRLTILKTLLDGPAVYRTLQKITGLKAGPLYHHVNQLRMAALILPKQRDLYELSRAGRNMIMIALGLEAFIGDGRRRPIGGAGEG